MRESIHTLLAGSSSLRFEHCFLKQVILVQRFGKDSKFYHFLGEVQEIGPSTNKTMRLSLIRKWVDFTEFQAKPTSFIFRFDKSVSLHNPSGATFTIEEALRAKAKERLAAAGARKMLQEHRTHMVECFEVLEISQSITKDEFLSLRKKLMLKFHPDRKNMSSLSPEAFDVESKKITDALSDVESFLNKQINRY